MPLVPKNAKSMRYTLLAAIAPKTRKASTWGDMGGPISKNRRPRSLGDVLRILLGFFRQPPEHPRTPRPSPAG